MESLINPRLRRGDCDEGVGVCVIWGCLEAAIF